MQTRASVIMVDCNFDLKWEKITQNAMFSELLEILMANISATVGNQMNAHRKYWLNLQNAKTPFTKWNK